MRAAFRLAFVIAFASAFLFLMAAWGLFVLLRTVNRDLALLFLLLNAVGVAIQCASLLQLRAAMQVIDPGSGLDAAQAQSLALVAINVYRAGFVTAQLFFGTWLFPLGYLVFRSGFLPRLLGVLLILDGVAELIWFLQAFLLPAYPAIKTPGTFVSLLAEVGLALWLLVRGVKDHPAGHAALPDPRRHRHHTAMTGSWGHVVRLTVVGGLAFWVANLAISLTPIAAEYRAALSIPYVPMLVEALVGGLLIALGVSGRWCVTPLRCRPRARLATGTGFSA